MANHPSALKRHRQSQKRRLINTTSTHKLKTQLKKLKSAVAAKKADEKGGLKRTDNNMMLMGMALFNTKEYEGALQAFRRAKTSKDSFNDARKWENYTLSELERLKAIKASEFELAKTTRETLEADESNVDAIGKRMLNDIEDNDGEVDQVDGDAETPAQ